jgi:predicted nucleic acid-binding protein
MPYFTYDTSVIISRKLFDLRYMPPTFLLSSVVLMELAGGAVDGSRRKVYEQLFLQYQKDKSLIVPTEDDWLSAAKVLYLLTHARKRSQKGKVQRLAPGASQRLALDVLIAVSARRWKAQVVTENWTDFKAIQRYCNTRIIKAATFFSR